MRGRFSNNVDAMRATAVQTVLAQAWRWLNPPGKILVIEIEEIKGSTRNAVPTGAAFRFSLGASFL